MTIHHEPTDTPIPVTNVADLQQRYEALTALAMRRGNWLSGPAAQLLSEADWDEQFNQYRQDLERLREIGDALRPVTLRDRCAVKREEGGAG